MCILRPCHRAFTTQDECSFLIALEAHQTHIYIHIYTHSCTATVTRERRYIVILEMQRSEAEASIYPVGYVYIYRETSHTVAIYCFRFFHVRVLGELRFVYYILMNFASIYARHVFMKHQFYSICKSVIDTVYRSSNDTSLKSP